MRKSISGLGLVQSMAVLYLIVWSVSPPLGIDLIYRLLALGLAAVWAFIALMRKIQLETVHIWAALFIVLVIFCAYFENNSLSDIIKQIANFMLFVSFIMFAFYYKKSLWHELSFFIPLIFLLLLYFNVTTTRALIADPTLARLIVRNDESVYTYMRQGVGGYALVYSQVLFFPAAFMWTLRVFKRSRIKFIISLAWVISYFFLLANASYSIAIFTSLAALFVMFFYKGKSIIGVIIVSLILFVGAMALILYVTPFREWLLVTFDGTAVAKKINDLVATSESGAAEGSIQVRVNAYMASFRALLRYPIIGSLWNKNVGAGGHSAVIDFFVKYGIAGGYMYTRMIYSVPNTFKKDNENKVVHYVSNALLVSAIFVSVLDNLSFETMFPLIILNAILLNDIKQWTDDKYENSLVSKSRSRSGG